MYTSGEDVLDFRLNFTVTKKKRTGFLNMSTINEETVILDNGKMNVFDITNWEFIDKNYESDEIMQS